MADEEKNEGSERTDDDILEEARENYELCCASDSEWREDAISDLTFIKGGEYSWDASALRSRKADGKPIITINELPTFIHQITNDQRMNTPSISVHATGYGADEEVAKVRQGMIRHIEYDSNADTAYDRAVNSAATIGVGYWYLDTEIENEPGFDQKIMFRSIRNTLSVRVDPLSTEPDGSDMRFAFIESLMARDDFKREYPDAEANNSTWLHGGEYSKWLMEDAVLVCRYWYVESEKATVIQLSNGETGWKDKLLDLPPGVEIVREREGTRKKVMLCKITGVDVLEKTEVKCKWIPVFPVYGDEIDIEGKVNRYGIVRNAKGPAKSYNVMMSGATEEVALRTRAPYIGVAGQFDGFEDQWAQANTRTFPYLEYNNVSVDGRPSPPPQRQPMADVPSGMLALAMHASDNIKKVTGLFDSSLGARGNATSGIQEREQQQQGDTANFHFSDNLNKAILQCARCINYMIAPYYDTERIVNIMRPDDTIDSDTINKRLPEPRIDEKTGAIISVLNDMTGGEFTVTVSAGPSYSSMRDEAQQFFANAMSASKDPATNAIVTYLAMRNSNAPGAEEATEMLKTLLPPPAKAVIDDGEKGQQNSPQMVMTPRGPVHAEQVPQIIGQLEQQLQQMQQQMQQADIAKQQAEATKAQSEALRQKNEQSALELDAQRVQIEQFTAETERQKAGSDALAEQAAAQLNIEKLRTEQMIAQSEMIRNAAENIRAQIEADTAPDEKASIPSLEDIAQLIITSRQPIEGMQITAPSGGVYSVRMQ
jgi:hypothetical protein